MCGYSSYVFDRFCNSTYVLTLLYKMHKFSFINMLSCCVFDSFSFSHVCKISKMWEIWLSNICVRFDEELLEVASSREIQRNSTFALKFQNDCAYVMYFKIENSKHLKWSRDHLVDLEKCWCSLEKRSLHIVYTTSGQNKTRTILGCRTDRSRAADLYGGTFALVCHPEETEQLRRRPRRQPGWTSAARIRSENAGNYS